MTNSSELVAMAEAEWNNESQKGNDKQAWISGWISGYLTGWGRGYVAGDDKYA
jgi:hypothetical protein